MTTVTETLLTIDEYAKLPDPGYPTELVRGRVVEMTQPKPLHGLVCLNIGFWLKLHLQTDDRGRAFSNDTGVITERGPDTIRGADVSYYSYQRVPRAQSLRDYFEVAPELVFEVLSEDDRWSKVLIKVGEYLEAGVSLVVVVEPELKALYLYRPDVAVEILNADDEFSAPEILGEFRIAVRSFF